MTRCDRMNCQLVNAFTARIMATKGSKKQLGRVWGKCERKPLYIFGKNMMKCACLNERRGIVRINKFYEACYLTEFGFAVALGVTRK